MHVAILADHTGSTHASGVERSTEALVAGLRDLGVRVTWIAPARDGVTRCDGDVHLLDMDGRYQVLYGFARWKAAVRRELETLSPDIVHGQGLLHNGIAAVGWRGTPRVVTAHGNPVEDARWQYPSATIPLLAPLLRSTAGRVVSRANMVVNVTPDWHANCPREPRAQVHIPNPIDPAFFGGEVPGASSRVLFFGGSRSIKGLDILLDAWPRVVAGRPDATLHVWGMAGDGSSPIAERCRATAGCTLEGLARGGDVARAMRSGAVLAVPSRFEVAPLAIAEAWAVGLPVVATAVGGVPAYADGAVILCEPTPESLETAILAALRHGAAGESVRRGLERAALHRREAVAAAHLALYERLLSSSGRG